MEKQRLDYPSAAEERNDGINTALFMQIFNIHQMKNHFAGITKHIQENGMYPKRAMLLKSFDIISNILFPNGAS